MNLLNIEKNIEKSVIEKVLGIVRTDVSTF